MTKPTQTTETLSAHDFLDAALFSDLAHGEDEIEVEVEGTAVPGERATREDPGHPPYAEDIGVWISDPKKCLFDALNKDAQERMEQAVLNRAQYLEEADYEEAMERRSDERRGR